MISFCNSYTKALLFVSIVVLYSIPPAKAQNLACSGNVMDDNEFLFYNNRNRVKSCQWLTEKNPDIRKPKYCWQGHIMGACRSSCNHCTCKNDDEFKFPKIKNPDELRTCAWIDKSPDKTETRRQNYCYKNEKGPGDTWIASDVGHECVKSCGFCVEGTQEECRPDNTSFHFELENGESKNCEWITRNDAKFQKRFDTYCYRGHVKGACGTSCKFCSCEDNKQYAFLTKKGKQVGCAWLTEKTDKINRRISKYCFENNDPQVASKIGNECVSSCGFCLESTGSDDSVAPSPQPTLSLSPTSEIPMTTDGSLKLTGTCELTDELEAEIVRGIKQSLYPVEVEVKVIEVVNSCGTGDTNAISANSENGKRLLAKADALRIFFEIISRLPPEAIDDNFLQDLAAVLQLPIGVEVVEGEIIIPFAPSSIPSLSPSTVPSTSAWPSPIPTMRPSTTPSREPSPMPSPFPTMRPSVMPSPTPTMRPSTTPSREPSPMPSPFPTMRPSTTPSSLPSSSPSAVPSVSVWPSPISTMRPSTTPSSLPSSSPSAVPSVSVWPSPIPTMRPSSTPSSLPSSNPSQFPSKSVWPSPIPTMRPSSTPSQFPSKSVWPSQIPSTSPSILPSASTSPSSHPSMNALQFSGKSYHGCALHNSIVQCVGSDQYGELGQMLPRYTGTPVTLNFLVDTLIPIKVVVGHLYTCTIIVDGI